MSTVSSLTGPNSFYRLEGEEPLDPSVPEDSKEIESKPVNEDPEATGVRMPEGIAKGSEKSVSEIVKSLSACLPAEEGALRIRIWDVHKDAEAIAPKLEGMHLSEKYSREQFKDLMFSEIKSTNTQDLNILMRCMLALNENWPFFDEMEVLEKCVEWKIEFLAWKSPYDQVEGNLLIRTIQKNALPERCIECIFANPRDWDRLSRLLRFFIRLDESKIKKYAKEFHFPFYSYFFHRFIIDSLESVLSAFKEENEDKLPLFLSSCEGEIHSQVLKLIFHHDSFSERIRKECLDVLFSLNLSKGARGFLMGYLLSNNLRYETEKRNEYLEDLLKQGHGISFPQKGEYLSRPRGYLPCRCIFLPTEGSEETKKATLDLLIKIVRNPCIQHPRPIDWVATVMAYLLNLDFSDIGRAESAPFDKKWYEGVTSQPILNLKEEDYSLLEEVVSILSTTKPILKGSLGVGLSLEVNLSILAFIFLGLDKLRLSGIEHFKREQDKKSWSNKIEDLMKKVTDAIASNLPHSPKFIDFHDSLPYTWPYTLIAFLFTKKLNEKQAISVFQAIERIDPQLHPLVKPFFAAWGALDKGERISL